MSRCLIVSSSRDRVISSHSQMISSACGRAHARPAGSRSDRARGSRSLTAAPRRSCTARGPPSCRHAASTAASAISRNVVVLPPVMVRKPATPSRDEWSSSACERVTSRVSATAAVSSNSGRTPAQACRARAWRKPGHELLALIEQEVDVGLADLGLVGVGDEHVGGPDHARGAQRQQDVAVGRPLASVDAHLHQAVVHRDHQAHPGADVDRAVRQLRDLAGPGARRVDDNSGANAELLATALAADVRAHHPVTVELEVEHAVIRKDAGAVFLRRPCATPDQLPWVERCVGNEERAPDVGIDTGLAPERLRDGDLLGRHPGRAAAVEELVAVLRVIPRRGRRTCHRCPRCSPPR